MHQTVSSVGSYRDYLDDANRHRSEGRPEEAKSILEELVRQTSPQDPEHWEAAHMLGVCHSMLGEYASADTVYRHLLGSEGVAPALRVRIRADWANALLGLGANGLTKNPRVLEQALEQVNSALRDAGALKDTEVTKAICIGFRARIKHAMDDPGWENDGRHATLLFATLPADAPGLYHTVAMAKCYAMDGLGSIARVYRDTLMERAQTIGNATHMGALDLADLHGNEPEEFINAMRQAGLKLY